MKKIHQIILLTAIAGLMFCIIPIEGMELNLSWQLASIWLGGAAFAAFLSSWWWRGFFLLALVRTATIMPPSYDSYIGLLMIAIFLAAAEGFSRIKPKHTTNAMCFAAIALLLWMAIQWLGWTRVWFPGHPAGPFNPDAGGVFLALCLPACMRRKWWWLVPFILAGIVITQTSTAMIAAAAAGVVFILQQKWDKKAIAIALIAVILGASIWFWQVKSLDSTINNSRWIAWQHAAMSMQAQPLGRGIGSWEIIFPLLASGDKRIGDVTNDGNKLVMSNVFCQAHNEYVQTAFELGGQTLLLIIGFLAAAGWIVLFRPVSPAPLKAQPLTGQAAAGMAALAVACFGWHLFHIPPTALLGVAWLGMWNQERKLSPIALHFSLPPLENKLSNGSREAFSGVGTINRAPRGSFVKAKAGLASLVIASLLILTPFSTVQASDHSTRVITILSSGIKTAATAQSTAFDVSAYEEGQIFVDVTVEASTSTLDIVIQISPDNVTWYTHTAMTQITAIGQYRQALTNFGKYLRIYYTVGGTSYTFSVVGVFKN